MDVAELVGIGADMAAQAALVELHVVHIVQHLQVWGADEPGQFRRRAGVAEEIAGMVRGDVQRLQIDPNTASFRPFRRDFQRVEHGAELHSVAEVVIGAKDPSSLPQTVGVERDGPCPYLHSGVQRTPQKGLVGRFLGRVDEGQLRVAVEAGNADAGGVRGGLHGGEILVGPAPEFYKLEAVGSGGAKPL